VQVAGGEVEKAKSEAKYKGMCPEDVPLLPSLSTRQWFNEGSPTHRGNYVQA